VKGRIVAACLALALSSAAVPAWAQDTDWDSGVEHFKKQEYRGAISDFNKVKDASPDFANTYFYIGLAHFFLKEYGKSIVHLTHYVELSEKQKSKVDAKARVALGRAYLLTDEYAKAAAELSEVTKTVTDDPINYYYLGVAYQKLNQNDKAIDAYTAALKINPKEVTTLDQLTRMLLAKAIQSNVKADWQAAVTRAEQLRIVRDDATTAQLLGNAYLGMGEFQKASVHLGRAVEANPKDGNGWFNYGLTLSRSQQFEKAETALKKAVELSPDNANAYAELGYVSESLKKYKEALSAYERANQLSPSAPLQESIDRVKGATATGA
jgi:tetratricopeptide (TPR) repeat protein